MEVAARTHVIKIKNTNRINTPTDIFIPLTFITKTIPKLSVKAFQPAGDQYRMKNDKIAIAIAAQVWIVLDKYLEYKSSFFVTGNVWVR